MIQTHQENAVRIACATENCGSFLMDPALYQKLQQTGETFYCPEGHPQHFSDAEILQYQQEIAHLKERLGFLEDECDEAWDEYLDERARRKTAEQLLLENVAGVIELWPDEWKWACECESHGAKAFETEEAAREAWQDHVRRKGCEVDIETTIQP